LSGVVIDQVGAAGADEDKMAAGPIAASAPTHRLVNRTENDPGALAVRARAPGEVVKRQPGRTLRRDLGKITLYRAGPRAEFTARYPNAGPPLTRRLKSELITDVWDDLLRVAASVKGGHAAAALVVGKPLTERRLWVVFGSRRYLDTRRRL
jgi:hypothetical protein